MIKPIPILLFLANFFKKKFLPDLFYIKNLIAFGDGSNRPFPSYLLPLFQNESTCETIHMKMSFTFTTIFMQIKVIFISMVSHIDSF